MSGFLSAEMCQRPLFLPFDFVHRRLRFLKMASRRAKPGALNHLGLGTLLCPRFPYNLMIRLGAHIFYAKNSGFQFDGGLLYHFLYKGHSGKYLVDAKFCSLPDISILYRI